MIFVDTGAWFAADIANDSDHLAAAAWMERNEQPLLTTDYVLDELLTLMKVRGEFARAVALGEEFFASPPSVVHHVSDSEVRAAFEVFRQFRDKAWSFTDCVSYVVIRQLGIPTAFSFDQHFRQFATVTIVP